MEFLNSIEQSSLSIWIRESGSIWSFPTILLLHTLGMSIVGFGASWLNAARVAEILGTDAGAIEVLKPFSQLGIDSLMAVELVQSIEADLDLTLGMGAILGGSRLTDLADSPGVEHEHLIAAREERVRQMRS